MRCVVSVLLVVLCGCAAPDGEPLSAGRAIARDVPPALLTRQADRRRLLALTEGDRTHVVVIAAESDDEDAVVAQLVAWQEAGTFHVLPLNLEHLDRAPALLRLAELIEISDSGPHLALHNAHVIQALRTAMDRGVPVMASGASAAELQECLGRE